MNDANKAAGQVMTVTGWARGLLRNWPEKVGEVTLQVDDKRAFAELVRLAEAGEERRPSEREIVFTAMGVPPQLRCELIIHACEVLSAAPDESSTWWSAAQALNSLLGSAEREVLGQLVLKGPVADGDICSKAARDYLMNRGLAQRAVVMGVQGFTAANYYGYRVHHAIRRLRGPQHMAAGEVSPIALPKGLLPPGLLGGEASTLMKVIGREDERKA